MNVQSRLQLGTWGLERNMGSWKPSGTPWTRSQGTLSAGFSGQSCRMLWKLQVLPDGLASCLLPVICSLFLLAAYFINTWSELKIRLWRSILWIEQLLKLRTVIPLTVGLSQPKDCDIGVRTRSAMDYNGGFRTGVLCNVSLVCLHRCGGNPVRKGRLLIKWSWPINFLSAQKTDYEPFISLQTEQTNKNQHGSWTWF